MQIGAHRPEIPVVRPGNLADEVVGSHDLKFDKGTSYIVYFHTDVHVHIQYNNTNTLLALNIQKCFSPKAYTYIKQRYQGNNIEKMGNLSKSKLKLYICDNKLRSCAQFAPKGKCAPGC